MICHCDAYPFPHRPGGGKCTPASAGEWYWKTDGHHCNRSCPFFAEDPSVGWSGCLLVSGDRTGICTGIARRSS